MKKVLTVLVALSLVSGLALAAPGKADNFYRGVTTVVVSQETSHEVEESSTVLETVIRELPKKCSKRESGPAK